MHPQSNPQQDQDLQQADLDLDIPLGSLDAAAMAEIPYTFRRGGTCTAYYNEFFG